MTIMLGYEVMRDAIGMREAIAAAYQVKAAAVYSPAAGGRRERVTITGEYREQRHT